MTIINPVFEWFRIGTSAAIQIATEQLFGLSKVSYWGHHSCNNVTDTKKHRLIFVAVVSARNCCLTLCYSDPYRFLLNCFLNVIVEKLKIKKNFFQMGTFIWKFWFWNFLKAGGVQKKVLLKGHSINYLLLYLSGLNLVEGKLTIEQ